MAGRPYTSPRQKAKDQSRLQAYESLANVLRSCSSDPDFSGRTEVLGVAIDCIDNVRDIVLQQVIDNQKSDLHEERGDSSDSEDSIRGYAPPPSPESGGSTQGLFGSVSSTDGVKCSISEGAMQDVAGSSQTARTTMVSPRSIPSTDDDESSTPQGIKEEGASSSQIATTATINPLPGPSASTGAVRKQY